jgi:hypothetical protein
MCPCIYIHGRHDTTQGVPVLAKKAQIGLVRHLEPKSAWIPESPVINRMAFVNMGVKLEINAVIHNFLYGENVKRGNLKDKVEI